MIWKCKDTRIRRHMSRYLAYNKISNVIYMVNYNLVLNVLNTPPQAKRRTWTNVKLGFEKFKERSRNNFHEDVNNLVRRRCRETLSWPSKTAKGSTLSGDAALASARICLTHEEGSLLSDDTALALVRICQPKSRRGNLEQGTKTLLKPEE